MTSVFDVGLILFGIGLVVGFVSALSFHVRFLRNLLGPGDERSYVLLNRGLVVTLILCGLGAALMLR